MYNLKFLYYVRTQLPTDDILCAHCGKLAKVQGLCGRYHQFLIMNGDRLREVEICYVCVKDITDKTAFIIDGKLWKIDNSIIID